MKDVESERRMFITIHVAEKLLSIKIHTNFYTEESPLHSSHSQFYSLGETRM